MSRFASRKAQGWAFATSSWYEGLSAVASLVGPRLTWTAQHGLSF